MNSSSAVLAALVEWLVEYQAKGGDYSEHAFRIGINATLDAERSGHSFADAFEAGRTAYFNAVNREDLSAAS